MQGLYYLAMLIGVVWLCVWSILPPERRARYWSPFDRRGGKPPPLADDGPARRPLRGGTAAAFPGSAARRGDDTGNNNAALPRPGGWRSRARTIADLQQPLPQPRAAQPRRVRGEPAAPPRGQRRG